MKKIVFYIDGSNFFYMQKDILGWWICPQKLLDWVRKRGEVIDAAYYTGVDPDHEAQQSFLTALCHMGYRLETKEYKIIQASNGEQIAKANLDVEIVLDMCMNVDSYDEVVLLSGDGDFRRPLRAIRNKGKQFFILSTKKCVSSDLRTIAGMNYKDLSLLEKELRRDSR